MRLLRALTLALPVVCAVALVAAGSGGTAGSAPDARSCAQQGSFFNVQLLGDKRASDWLASSDKPLPGAPQRRALAVVWSLGGPTSTSGIAVYGWTTRAMSRFAPTCRLARTLKTPARARLRPVVRVKDGWHLEHRYGCVLPGRFVVRVQQLRDGRRLTVRMERSGELIAVAEIRSGGGTLRASTRCEQR